MPETLRWRCDWQGAPEHGADFDTEAEAQEFATHMRDNRYMAHVVVFPLPVHP